MIIRCVCIYILKSDVVTGMPNWEFQRKLSIHWFSRLAMERVVDREINRKSEGIGGFSMFTSLIEEKLLGSAGLLYSFYVINQHVIAWVRGYPPGHHDLYQTWLPPVSQDVLTHWFRGHTNRISGYFTMENTLFERGSKISYPSLSLETFEPLPWQPVIGQCRSEKTRNRWWIVRSLGHPVASPGRGGWFYMVSLSHDIVGRSCHELCHLSGLWKKSFVNLGKLGTGSTIELSQPFSNPINWQEDQVWIPDAGPKPLWDGFCTMVSGLKMPTKLISSNKVQ